MAFGSQYQTAETGYKLNHCLNASSTIAGRMRRYSQPFMSLRSRLMGRLDSASSGVLDDARVNTLE